MREHPYASVPWGRNVNWVMVALKEVPEGCEVIQVHEGQGSRGAPPSCFWSSPICLPDCKDSGGLIQALSPHHATPPLSLLNWWQTGDKHHHFKPTGVNDNARHAAIAGLKS